MATRLTTTRQERGEAIAHLEGQIKRIDENTYEVLFQSGNGKYEILNTSIGWMCQCPDHIYRGVKCKHIYAVEISNALRAEVKVRRIEPIENVTECIYCGSSNLKKDGLRRNKSGLLQKYYCRTCHKYMTFNIGFEKMKHNPQAVTTAMQLYFSGESLRNTMHSLKLLGVEVSHQTVYNWIKKYVKLMKAYAEKLVPNVGDRGSYRLGSSEVNISEEQAVNIALERVKSFSYLYDDKEITNFNIVTEKIDSHTGFLNRTERFVMYPCYVVDLPLDHIYPGSVSYIEVMVWADSGEVVSCEALGYGFPSEDPNQTSSAGNTQTGDDSAPPTTLYIALAVVAITIAVAALVLRKRRSK